MSAMSRFAVVGNPISHSLSPEIHRRFAAEFGHALSYERVESPIEGFRDTVSRLRQQGFGGCNVTLPFKEEAFRLCGQVTDRARSCGAVNTLVLGDEILGDNTDGAGLIADIGNRLGFDVRGKTVLVLGAGGAARGVLPALLARGPRRLAVANRTLDRARRLAGDFGAEALSYPEASRETYDCVINATSLSLSGMAPPVEAGVFRGAGLAYDLVYGARPTPFMELARRGGAGIVSDGLGMLVEQAAESYLLWQGVRPATPEVYAGLRKGLS